MPRIVEHMRESGQWQPIEVRTTRSGRCFGRMLLAEGAMGGRGQSGQTFWVAADRLGLGLPVAAAAAMSVAGVASDRLLVVTAILLLGPYLVGYLAGLIARGSSKPDALFGVSATGLITGAALVALSRDATALVYLVAPACGLLVAAGSAALSRGRTDQLKY